MSEQKASQTILGAGKVFAEGREALDLTREQTADILNLSVRVIRAIEESEPDKLPSSVYVNGYIRSYSKLLGLAAQPLIDAWWAQNAQHPPDEAAAESITDRAPSDESARPFKMGRWALLASVLSLGFVYFVTSSNPDGIEEDGAEAASQVLAATIQEQPEVFGDLREARAGEGAAVEESSLEPEVPPVGENTEMNAETVGEIKLELAETAADISPESGQEALVEPQSLAVETPVRALAEKKALGGSVELFSVASEVIPESVTPAETETIVDDREVATAFGLPRLTALGDDEISLSFTSDCWFEIRNEAGVLLYADLGRTGQTRFYVGQGPFRIKLGYSPGVTLIFNDVEVDLKPFTRRDLANLLVGADEQPGNASDSIPST